MLAAALASLLLQLLPLTLSWSLPVADEGMPALFAVSRLGSELQSLEEPSSDFGGGAEFLDDVLLMPGARPDGVDLDDVLLVRMEAPPVAVEDDEADVGGLSRLLRLEARAAPKDHRDHLEEGGVVPVLFLSSLSDDAVPPQEDEMPVPEDGAVLLMRFGRGLKSVQDSVEEGDAQPYASRLTRSSQGQAEQQADDVRESRVLEEDDISFDDADLFDDEAAEAPRRRPRRAALPPLRLSVRRVRADNGQVDGQVDKSLRADAAPPPAEGGGGSFMETVQNQLPGQLQGLGGAMEDSQMVVGTFQAILMPARAATDLGQQIQGFISNMPQMPSLPGGAGG